jgi:hypothetical protein
VELRRQFKEPDFPGFTNFIKSLSQIVTLPKGWIEALDVIKQIHQRLVKLAQADGLAAGRKMRVDTTVVETNIHYPTDSSLLGDGVRVLIRTMKSIGRIAGKAGTRLCDRRVRALRVD